MSNYDPKKSSGDKKDPLWLLPSAGLRPTSRVMRLGAEKYGLHNFRDNEVCASTYVSAILRHMQEWNDGIDADDESGEHPLAHVIASAMIVLDAIKHETLKDDRWKPCNSQSDSETAKCPTSAEVEPEANTATAIATALGSITSPAEFALQPNPTGKRGQTSWTRCDGSPFTLPSNIGHPKD